MAKRTKVRFCNRGGWDGEYERAALILKHRYTRPVYQSSSEVLWEGIKEGIDTVYVYEIENGIDYGRHKRTSECTSTKRYIAL